MSILATEVRFDDDTMWVALDDGRTIGVPLAWFPAFWLRLWNNGASLRSAPAASTGINLMKTFPSPDCSPAAVT